MARVFISGSSTGLGLMSAALLSEEGHQVVLHARNPECADVTRASLPHAAAVVQGDVSSIAGARSVAEQVNLLGRFDAVIHNVGVGYREQQRRETKDGLPYVFATNTLAPFILTALIEKPARLIYLSSGMHRGADAHLEDLTWTKRAWRGAEAYAETKLHDVMLAFGIARRWVNVFSNALEPGWVPTRMGGPGASDDLDQAHRTQAWLAVSDDREARVTGQYFYHLRRRDANPQARDPHLQDALIEACERLSGLKLE
jgi:NAD(P)-dependent dehydrogenase (short-subunit alcohol dehydrogenase family)